MLDGQWTEHAHTQRFGTVDGDAPGTVGPGIHSPHHPPDHTPGLLQRGCSKTRRTDRWYNRGAP